MREKRNAITLREKCIELIVKMGTDIRHKDIIGAQNSITGNWFSQNIKIYSNVHENVK